MVNYKGAHGGQLDERMRPYGHVRAGAHELGAKAGQDVVAGVMAKRHQERAEKDPSLGPPRQALGEGGGRAQDHVAPAKIEQRSLEGGQRRLALRATMARERDDAPGPLGKGSVERGGHDGIVLLGRKQGRGKAQLVEARGGASHVPRARAVKTAVGQVSGDDERMPDPAGPQPRKGLDHRRPHGAPSRAGAQRHVGSHRQRKLAHERLHARAPPLAREAAGYDQALQGHEHAPVIRLWSIIRSAFICWVILRVVPE